MTTPEAALCLAAEAGDVASIRARLAGPSAPSVDCVNEVGSIAAARRLGVEEERPLGPASTSVFPHRLHNGPNP